MNRRDAESAEINKITEAVIGAAIEVHRALGPGLLESAYAECLCHELALRKLPFVLRLRGWKIGLLLNFSTRVLKDGIRRIVLGLPELSAASASLR